MKTLQFKCTLLSDIILNQKAATKGANATLDFIPGSNFLGIVAGKLYGSVNSKVALELFHSGKVRFGDAHLAHGNVRTLHVPADMYKPKLASAKAGFYILHKTNTKLEEIKRLQLKQCRTGYYDFSSAEAEEVKPEVNFAIKSAHDKNTRTSADEQMYGYQSLQAGKELYFEVEVDNDALVQAIKDSLIGKKRVGRSRSAQYGLVEIEETSFKFVHSNPNTKDETVVYADSRLIFLDENGECVFRPTEKQLGIEGGEIDWERSQIRTFQYSPWNFKRQCFDTDRCGIEKGSVIVIKGGTCPEKNAYVGSYQNEGFGRVIYNPEFLAANGDGTAKYTLVSEQPTENPKEEVTYNSTLVNYLKGQKHIEETEKDIFECVNKWVRDNASKFKGDSFSSQWGTIRSLASALDNGDICEQLFKKPDKDKKQTGGYLMHGTAEEKWRKGQRKELFEKFVNNFTTESEKRLAIVNLASEMAKRNRKEEEK